MFLDVFGCFWMFWDVKGRFGTFWGCFGTFLSFCDVLGYFGTFWDILGRFGAFWGVFWDVLRLKIRACFGNKGFMIIQKYGAKVIKWLSMNGHQTWFKNLFLIASIGGCFSQVQQVQRS